MVNLEKVWGIFMHMSDALISPAVAGAMWLVSGSSVIYSAQKIKDEVDYEQKIPLMGILGAFVFAVQMLNFTIPATGSSGHFAGGFFLALLLGPYMTMIAMSSVLTVQSLFFADGGILALGCNIFNLGFIPAFITFPLYLIVVKRADPSPLPIVLFGLVTLLMGAFMVVVETTLSGVTELPFSNFVMLMIPIHILIGVVEGFITYVALKFVRKNVDIKSELPKGSFMKRWVVLWTVIFVLGGILSWYASSNPDGLEWSMFSVMNAEAEPESSITSVHHFFEHLQSKISFLPDYGIEGINEKAGTTISGVLGSIVVFFVAFLAGWLIKKRWKSFN